METSCLILALGLEPRWCPFPASHWLALQTPGESAGSLLQGHRTPAAAATTLGANTHSPGRRVGYSEVALALAAPASQGHRVNSVTRQALCTEVRRCSPIAPAQCEGTQAHEEIKHHSTNSRSILSSQMKEQQIHTGASPSPSTHTIRGQRPGRERHLVARAGRSPKQCGSQEC